jgi:hypothetical protein
MTVIREIKRRNIRWMEIVILMGQIRKGYRALVEDLEGKTKHT